MASVINTNVSSLNAQRNLNASQSDLATSLQRLSSGLRINSAKDDAAGLAISDRFTTQIRGLNQASRNANDAISLSQTAEGALSEVTSNLQRIRELAVQSANATNSSSDRAALDLEVQQRLAEIDRISSQTAFNGQKILDGSFGNAAFQVGANVGETITLDLTTSMRPNVIGDMAIATSTADLNTLATDVPIPGTSTSAAITPIDFSTVIDGTAGQSEITFTAKATDAVATIDGVTFTFVVDGGATTTPAFAETADNTITITASDFTDVTTSAKALDDAIAFAKASGGAVTQASLVDVGDATSALGVTTINYLDHAVPSVAHAGNGITGTGVSMTTEDAAGALDDTSANETITVGATAVLLNTNIASADDLVTIINNALTADSNTDVIASAGSNGELIISTTATGATATAPTLSAVALSDSETMLGTIVPFNGLDAATLNIATGEFDIQLGDSTAVSVTGQFTTAQSFVDAVNTALAGNASAELNDDGTISIFSDEDVTITGTVALSTMGLPSLTATDGSLEDGNILDVDASNDIIRRVDSALTSISDLRSTFGAIQNRFESTITNLATSVENLSASRSRILDADFAAETAALTRAQILQQAGTAMLSQANAIPQNVLSLLQG